MAPTSKTFVTYACFPWFGWLAYGWFIVGISPYRIYGGYAAEFAQRGCQLKLIEYQGEKTVLNFWFKPSHLFEVPCMTPEEYKQEVEKQYAN